MLGIGLVLLYVVVALALGLYWVDRRRLLWCLFWPAALVASLVTWLVARRRSRRPTAARDFAESAFFRRQLEDIATTQEAWEDVRCRTYRAAPEIDRAMLDDTLARLADRLGPVEPVEHGGGVEPDGTDGDEPTGRWDRSDLFAGARRVYREDAGGGEEVVEVGHCPEGSTTGDKHPATTAWLAAPEHAAAVARARANCDGCSRGLRMNDGGVHVDEDYHPVQACVAEIHLPGEVRFAAAIRDENSWRRPLPNRVDTPEQAPRACSCPHQDEREPDHDPDCPTRRLDLNVDELYGVRSVYTGLRR